MCCGHKIFSQEVGWFISGNRAIRCNKDTGPSLVVIQKCCKFCNFFIQEGWVLALNIVEVL